jgi:aminoglycoside phosphotransferase (APT) family kinase protein
MRQVADVLTDVWTTTITPVRPRIDYTNQIRSRMREVLRRHSRLEKVAKEQLEGFGGLFDLLSHLESREAWIAPPFSIWMHGDLNANNIVVDQPSGSVVFIDVHRSQYGDYLQDIATLCASSAAVPEGPHRQGHLARNEVLTDAAEEFGRTSGDKLSRSGCGSPAPAHSTSAPRDRPERRSSSSSRASATSRRLRRR